MLRASRGSATKLGSFTFTRAQAGSGLEDACGLYTVQHKTSLRDRQRERERERENKIERNALSASIPSALSALCPRCRFHNGIIFLQATAASPLSLRAELRKEKEPKELYFPPASRSASLSVSLCHRQRPGLLPRGWDGSILFLLSGSGRRGEKFGVKGANRHTPGLVWIESLLRYACRKQKSAPELEWPRAELARHCTNHAQTAIRCHLVPYRLCKWKLQEAASFASKSYCTP